MSPIAVGDGIGCYGGTVLYIDILRGACRRDRWSTLGAPHGGADRHHTAADPTGCVDLRGGCQRDVAAGNDFDVAARSAWRGAAGGQLAFDDDRAADAVQRDGAGPIADCRSADLAARLH